MTRTALIRSLLAVALALSLGIDSAGALCLGTDSARAQCPSITACPPPNNPVPGPAPRDNSNKVLWYVVGGVAVGILGWVIGTQVFSEPKPPTRPTLPPDQLSPSTQASLPPITQLPINLPPPGGGPGTT